jgi:hypothetical protein
VVKLTPFFKQVIEVQWSEFAKAEKDQTFTSSEGVVYALIRACVKGKLPAIKEALNRVDGKVAMEIDVEYPKFYMLYPLATEVADSPPELDTVNTLAASATVSGDEPAPEEESATNSLRDTLTRMGDEPSSLATSILAWSKTIDTCVARGEELPTSDPYVKSVIVAGLLKLAHNGGLGAIFEVLDQIDGKVAEKIKLLGGDAYLTNYSEVAPAGAIKNKDGIYQLEADNTTSSWAVALERKVNRGRVGR